MATAPYNRKKGRNNGWDIGLNSVASSQKCKFVLSNKINEMKFKWNVKEMKCK